MIESKSPPLSGSLHPPSASPVARDLGAMALLDSLLRRRRLVFATTFVSTLIAVVPPLAKLVLDRREYVAEALVTPAPRRGPSAGGLSGLAAQFGVSVPGSDPTQSPAFFVDLMRSPSLLDEVASRRVVPRGVRDSITLAAHFDIDEPEPARRVDETRRELNSRLGIEPSQRSGIITMRMRDEDPAVARQVLAHLIRVVGEVNVASRRNQAGSERRFTEQRMRTAAAELRAAENRQREFLAGNRGCCSSPDLQLERDRVEREVMMRQQVYTQLVQAFEQARIEEVRDTPALIVVGGPTTPARPESERIPGRAVVGVLLGLALGAFLAFVGQLVEEHRNHDPVRYEATLARLRALGRDIVRPWRLFARSA